MGVKKLVTTNSQIHNHPSLRFPPSLQSPSHTGSTRVDTRRMVLVCRSTRPARCSDRREALSGYPGLSPTRSPPKHLFYGAWWWLPYRVRQWPHTRSSSARARWIRFHGLQSAAASLRGLPEWMLLLPASVRHQQVLWSMAAQDIYPIRRRRAHEPSQPPTGLAERKSWIRRLLFLDQKFQI